MEIDSKGPIIETEQYLFVLNVGRRFARSGGSP